MANGHEGWREWGPHLRGGLNEHKWGDERQDPEQNLVNDTFCHPI